VKLYKDLTKKDLLSILLFIMPSLKDRIKNIKMNVKKNRWAETYKPEFNNKDKSLFIRKYTVRSFDMHKFDKCISEAIKIEPNWDITCRYSVYKGETRSSVYYADEWSTPKAILKIYAYIKSLGYLVEEEL